MAGRKIGVGFNQPRIIGGRMQFEWQRRYALMRRLTRLQRVRRFVWQQPVAWSVTETSRRYLQDK